MTDAFFFGARQRALFGNLHATTGASRGAVLICQPLLQEGIRCHRALWTLANALADAGLDALRFDWFGSGDSDGESAQASLDNWMEDLQSAMALLEPAASTSLRALGMRSSALPLLAYAARRRQPLDLILWDPWLSGSEMLSCWQLHHQMQFDSVGRYTNRIPSAEAGALQGFDISADTLQELAGLAGNSLIPPAGSHVLVAVWEATPALQNVLAAWQVAGVSSEVLVFDEADCPDWQNANAIESQVFPRRSVVQLAKKIAESTL